MPKRIIPNISKLDEETQMLVRSADIASQLPVQFDSGFKLTSFSGQCNTCEANFTAKELFGTVKLVNKTSAEMHAACICEKCRLVTKFRCTVDDQGNCQSWDKDGVSHALIPMGGVAPCATPRATHRATRTERVTWMGLSLRRLTFGDSLWAAFVTTVMVFLVVWTVPDALISALSSLTGISGLTGSILSGLWMANFCVELLNRAHRGQKKSWSGYFLVLVPVAFIGNLVGILAYDFLNAIF